ncbi:hypothetical protein C5S35_00205, partial [Candidatus Methanophagaceae archaeon]
MKTKTRGKAIAGIALAVVIVVAAVMVAMIGSTGAKSTGGEYNIIVNQTEIQPVLIGHDLEFRNTDWTSPPVVQRYISGDLEDTYTAILKDGKYYLYNVNWPATGAYYVNGDSATNEAQLSVEEPKMPLKLKVKDTEVTSLARSTILNVDVGGINLGDEDVVSLVIIGPKGKITEKNGQQFKAITVASLKDMNGDNAIDTTGWSIGHYTFQVKTQPEKACGLDVHSVKKELDIVTGTVQITADTTEVPEFERVKLTVTGIAGHAIKVTADPISKNAYFPAGLDDNPNMTTNWFSDRIDDDCKRTYAVVFNDTGAYTIKVIDLNESDSYDTVDIIVTDRQVTFDVPDFVQIAENFTIRGTANTSDTGTVDTVTVAVDDEVVQGLDCIILDDNGEFEVEIDTSAADAPAAFAFKAPGTVQLKAYIDRQAESDYPAFVHSNERADGATTVFIQNEKGGGIGISAPELIMCMNGSIILTIHAAADHNVSVTTADPVHTVFGYNRYDFTGTSNNIINVAPTDTISIPTAIGDCDSQSKAKNIHGVWETMDADGTSEFVVHFSDPGTYKITATDYGTGYPTATRLDEEEIEITVTGDSVTFNVPSIVAIGERFTIKGTTSYGDTVTVAVNDEVVNKLYQIVIDENGKFEEDIDTSSSDSPSAFMIPGSVRLKAYIDYEKSKSDWLPTTIPSDVEEDGFTEIFMVRGWLTASLSEDTVEPDDDFTISGTAKGSKSVSILIVAPKGYSGSNIEGGNGMYYATTSVTVDENIFYKKISVGDNVDTGRYLIMGLTAGSDGKWGKYGYDVLYNPDNPEDPYTALGQYTLYNRTQEEMLAIFEDMVFYSDDDIWMGHITVAHEGTIIVQKMYTYSCPGTGG